MGKGIGLCWVTGANGQLAHELVKHLNNYVATSRDEVDITDLNEVLNYAYGKNIKWIINCSAYTNVEKAEEEYNEAYNVNVNGVDNLVNSCQIIGARLITISTDYVFGGDLNRPYTPEDSTKPLNAYGETKRMGEDTALLFTNAWVIRTSWLYNKEYGKNFYRTMQRLENPKVIDDQFGTPTDVVNLSDFIVRVMDKQPESRLLHFSDGVVMSWYEFAKSINPNAQPIKSLDYPQKAVRPKYSALKPSEI